MQLIVHDHAEADLERLFESKEEAVGYIDNVIALIDDTPALFDKLFSETTAAITISLSGFWVWNANVWRCCGVRIYA